ncbi:MAG: hypothetical protein ACR2OZ_03510 [Verrucomicrobiales bacterium]
MLSPIEIILHSFRFPDRHRGSAEEECNQSSDHSNDAQDLYYSGRSTL